MEIEVAVVPICTVCREKSEKLEDHLIVVAGNKFPDHKLCEDCVRKFTFAGFINKSPKKV